MDLPVEITPLDEGDAPGSLSHGTLHDLSPGGCAFYLDREIPIGYRLHLRIVLNEELARKFNRPELNARGAVIRSVHEPDGFLLSVRFLPSKSKA